MLSFNEIRKEFDSGLTGINAYRAMIKEYLQCKVLETVDWIDKKREIEKFLFNTDEANKVQLFLSFATEETIVSWLK